MNEKENRMIQMEAIREGYERQLVRLRLERSIAAEQAKGAADNLNFSRSCSTRNGGGYAGPLSATPTLAFTPVCMLPLAL
jgi:hypothetical protein